MTFDPKIFKTQWPGVFHEILEDAWSMGFVPTVIGGVVRDFLMKGIAGFDWDIEVRHPTVAFNRNHWKEFGRLLSRHGKVNYLPFEVIRLEVKNYHFEFSPPRREIFMPDWQAHGHKNFEVEFDFKLSPEAACRRRDFSINAMGVQITRDQLTLIDPLNGTEHLNQKILCPCGPDFEKDPVRFLRAYRFRTKLGFSFSDELQKILATMPLEQFSAHYLWEEMKKSGNPLEFYRELILSPRDLPLPVGHELLTHWSEVKTLLTHPLEHEFWVLTLESIGIASEGWQKFFNVGSDSLRKLGRWAQTSKAFMKIKPEEFQGEFEVIRETKNFDLLFDWYFTTKQLISKNPNLPLMKFIETELPDWVHLYRFEPLKDLKHIDPPQRARYQLWNLCQRL